MTFGDLNLMRTSEQAGIYLYLRHAIPGACAAFIEWQDIGNYMKLQGDQPQELVIHFTLKGVPGVIRTTGYFDKTSFRRA